MFRKKLLIGTLTALLSVGLFYSSVNAESVFTDVDEDYWGYPSITTLVNQDIINGFPDGTYRPEQPLSRAQSAIIIGKTLEINPNITPTHSFTDVNGSVSGHQYVYALAEEGVFAKVDQFNPNNPLTRAQMAKVLVEAFDLQAEGNVQVNFSDVDRDHWAYSYIDVLVDTGITAGTSEFTFSPSESVTRVQMAVFVDRTLRYLNGEKPVVDVPGQNDRPQEYYAIADEILMLTNQERTERGLPALKIDTELQEVAMVKAKDFDVNKYFAHTSPVYGSPFDMMGEFNIDFRSAGENIAYGQPSAASVVEGWMNSEGHRKNILNGSFTHIGIGYYKDENGRPYYVQMFIGK
ncbi:S-layer homology domain-containing protein [Filobacillus milosensis]|nr:S-layer homology domain-containing protein [Filobacillus milosensis]